MSKMKKACCITLNPAFAPGFQATINSILYHTKSFDEKILCIDLGLSENDKKDCLNVYNNIEFKEPIKENYKKLPTHTPPLTNAFYKLEIFKFASEYDRLLFFDCDIVFVDSIQPLLDIIPNTARLTYHKSQKEFNTGLILLPKLNPNVYRKIINLVKTTKRAWLADQPIINTAIKKDILKTNKLNIKWNVTKRNAKKTKDYIGLHFVGKKPWKSGDPDYRELEKIWHRYYKINFEK